MYTMHAALTWSTSPNLSIIALYALILIVIQILALVMMFLQCLPPYIPAHGCFPVSGICFTVGYLKTVTMALSKYTLIYLGWTGDPLMHGMKKVKALTGGAAAAARAGDRGRRGACFEHKDISLAHIPMPWTFAFCLLFICILFLSSNVGTVDSCSTGTGRMQVVIMDLSEVLGSVVKGEAVVLSLGRTAWQLGNCHANAGKPQVVTAVATEGAEGLGSTLPSSRYLFPPLFTPALFN
jgi:hypothetical protein